MRRGLTILMFCIVLFFCAAVAIVYISIGPVITSTIEEYGSAITRTNVAVQDTDFTPTTGEATLVNLTVANPPGFSPDAAISVSKIEMQLDPESLNNEVLVIKRLKIEAPEIFYEIAADGDNLRTLRSRIKEAMAAEQQPAAAKPPRPPMKKFIVRDLYLANGVVVVQSKDLAGKRATAVLEPIHLTDLGRAEGGLTPAGLAYAIYNPILQKTTLAALSTDLNLTDQARNILRGAGDETEEVIDKVQKLFGK